MGTGTRTAPPIHPMSDRMTAVCVELYCVSSLVQCCYPNRMTAVCVELYCVSSLVQCCYPNRMTVYLH